MSVPESTFNYVLPQDFLTHVVVGRAAHALNNTASQFSTHSTTKEAAAGLPVAAAFGFIPGINPGPNDLRISLNGSKKYFVDRTTPLILSYVKDDKYYYPLVVSTLFDITSIVLHRNNKQLKVLVREVWTNEELEP
jgi:hypothetical protein